MRKRSVTPELLIVTSTNSHFPEGARLAIDGPIPAALKPHIAPFDGLVAGRLVLQVDADAFEQQVEADARRQSQVPKGSDTCSHDEIVKEWFGGDLAAFEAAQRLNFPTRAGMRVKGRERLESFWDRRPVRQWADRIRATAAALAR